MYEGHDGDGPGGSGRDYMSRPHGRLSGVTDQLAQVNIARLRAPLTDPLLADFVDLLAPVNAAADAAPGFVWRLGDEEGNATAIPAFAWDVAGSAGIITNMSVWTDLGSLTAFVYDEMHVQVLRRRREWFERMSEAYAACWWVPEGHRPSTDEAEERVRHLRAHGPTQTAFTLRVSFPPSLVVTTEVASIL